MIRRFVPVLLTALGVLTASLAAAQSAPAGAMPSKMALTIPEAIELAWQNNITSVRQRNSLDDAIAKRREARQTYLPSLSLDMRWNRVNTTQRFFINEQELFTDQFYDLGLTLSQPIFDGLNYIHTPKARTADIRSNEQGVKGTRQQVAYDTKRVCYDLLKAQRLSDVQQRAVQRSEEQLETSKARYELGSASMSDFLKSKVQLGRDSLELITRLNNIEVGRATLNDYLGLPVDRATEIDVEFNRDPYPVPDGVALKAAVETHPNVLGAMYSKESASHTIGSAQSAMWPWISAFASYSFSSGRFPESSDEFFELDNHRIGLNLNWTIFSGFSTTSRVQQAKIARHTAEEELAQSRRAVSLEITTASLRVREAFQRMRVSDTQVESAQEDLDIAQEKYNLGAATILDILTAQVAISEAETELIQAGYDWVLSIAELERAMGGGD